MKTFRNTFPAVCGRFSNRDDKTDGGGVVVVRETASSSSLSSSWSAGALLGGAVAAAASSAALLLLRRPPIISVGEDAAASLRTAANGSNDGADWVVLYYCACITASGPITLYITASSICITSSVPFSQYREVRILFCYLNCFYVSKSY
jgi:hypothetical protein